MGGRNSRSASGKEAVYSVNAGIWVTATYTGWNEIILATHLLQSGRNLTADDASAGPDAMSIRVTYTTEDEAKENHAKILDGIKNGKPMVDISPRPVEPKA